MASFYPSLEAYTADVLAARRAYRMDQRVATGHCETGDGRRVTGKNRRCWACKKRPY